MTAATGSPAGWRSLPSRFAEVVARHPGRPAVVAPDTTLSFAELDRRSSAVAAALVARGYGPESTVGLCLTRTSGLVVGLLGVIRAGAAYLPLDPAHPTDRLAAMVDAAAASFVLADSTTARRCAVLSGIEVGRVAEFRAGELDPPVAHPAGLLYTMFTSGTTGVPKGIAVPHGAVTALLDALDAAGVPTPAPSRVGWNASFSFDASVQQWVRLFRGDTVVLIDEQVRTDPALMAAFVREQVLTELDITPAHLAMLLDHLHPDAAHPLRLLVGGEAMSRTLWDRVAGTAAVSAVNVYGPTECTVDATADHVAPGTEPRIGSALPGVRLYLLDSALRPAEDGAEGEIYLAGTGVARGYVGAPATTAARFVADPFAADGSRIYRTGDRARRAPDGTLVYLGRSDEQFKLHGHRIEPGEIEAAVASVPGVGAVVVVLRDDLPGGAGIVAYHRATRPIPVAELRAAVAARLPGYMIPAAFVRVSRLPTSVNGKLDRARLPAPSSVDPPVDEDRPEYEAPVGPTEELLASTWSEMLKVDKVGAADNFFDLGGQSVLAIGLAARLRRALARTVPMVAVFRNPRLRDLATYLDGVTSGGQGGRDA